MIGSRSWEWPAAETDKLRELVIAGLSARQIGFLMSKTRNAIIGKVHRLGLQLNGSRNGNSRGEPKKPRSKRIPGMEPTKRRQTNFNLSARSNRPLRLPPARPAVDPIIPVNDGAGITILELRRDVCHTVVGSSRPRDSLPRYCGHPTWDETAYCEGHYAAFHNPNYR